MADKADLWMPLYVGDYLAATTRLTTEQHGAYFLLMLDYWKSGPPPDDDIVLAHIARMSPDAWSNAKASLARFFTVKDGLWRQKRIDVELGKAQTQKDFRKQRASDAARKRWGTQGDALSNACSNATSMPEAMLERCPSPSPIKEPKKEEGARGARLAPDWRLPATWGQWARDEKGWTDQAIRDQAAQFADYWHGVPGAKGRKADWQATWRNWVRKAESGFGKAAKTVNGKEYYGV